jgi:hypothetical protein
LPDSLQVLVAKGLDFYAKIFFLIFKAVTNLNLNFKKAVTKEKKVKS